MATPRNTGNAPGGAAGRAGDANANSTASAGMPRFTLKPSKQTCIILGGAMGLMLAGCVGLYVWQTSDLAAIQKQVDDKRNEVASGQKIANRLVQVESDYNDTQGKLRFLETSVSENQYVPTLLHQTEGLAKSTNLQVSSLRPSLEPAPKPDPNNKDPKAAPPQPYDKIHIDMDIHGTYWNVAQMLYRLTEFPKIMAVENVQLSPAGPATGPGASPPLGVHLRLTGFIFPNDGTATPAMPIGTVPGAPGAPGVPGAPGTPGASTVVPPQQSPTTTPQRPSQTGAAPQQRVMAAPSPAHATTGA